MPPVAAVVAGGFAIEAGVAATGLMAGLQIAGGVAMIAGTVTGNQKLSMLGGIAAGVGALGSSGFFGEGVKSLGTSGASAAKNLSGAVGESGALVKSATDVVGQQASSLSTEGLMSQGLKGASESSLYTDFSGNLAGSPGVNAATGGLSSTAGSAFGPSASGAGSLTDQITNQSLGINGGAAASQAPSTSTSFLNQIKNLDSGTKQLVGGAAQGVSSYFSETEKAKLLTSAKLAEQQGNFNEANRLRALYNDSLKAQPVASVVNPNAANPYAVPSVNVMTTTSTPAYPAGLINQPRPA